MLDYVVFMSGIIGRLLQSATELSLVIVCAPGCCHTAVISNSWSHYTHRHNHKETKSVLREDVIQLQSFFTAVCAVLDKPYLDFVN